MIAGYARATNIPIKQIAIKKRVCIDGFYIHS